MILYLHGYRSSPASAKARRLHAALAAAGRADDYLCPPLPPSPRAAAEVALASAQLEDPRHLFVVGSSLGGYYATWLVETLGCRAVLLNPAVRPYDLFATRAAAGIADAAVAPEYLDELRALEVGALAQPGRYFLVAATGDEVIDYREMLARYAGCPARLIQGSDHALSDFDAHLPEVLRFCEVSSPTGGSAGGTS